MKSHEENEDKKINWKLEKREENKKQKNSFRKIN
jgi:hypothetical protein